MKFRTRLIVYYLAAALIAMSLVGLAVLRGIEHYGMLAVEEQLIEQSESALVYAKQVYFLERNESQELSRQTARHITNNLSAGQRQVRIYDQQLNLLSASVNGVEQALAGVGIPSAGSLASALAGNYAYAVRNNNVYFAAPIDLAGEAAGVLEFVYPLDFLNEVLRVTSRIFMMGAAGFGIIITLFSIAIAGKMVAPIKQLVKATDKYAKRDFSPLDIKRADELGQLSESFNQMGEKLQEYIQRQKQFVSNVSHELRTPLTAIKGYAEYMTTEVKGKPDLEKAVYHLNNESARLAKLVDELLLLSRIDANKEQFLFEKLDFSQLVVETTSRLNIRAKKYKVAIELHVEPDVYVFGDQLKLAQVIINLLDNGIKFSPVNSSVEVCLQAKNEKAKLIIKDRGMGIPKQDLEKVFDRFYRAENAASVGGTGLGLAIAKEIITSHKGTITLSSRPKGEGTKLEVSLPQP